MNPWIALLLGTIQGFIEFFPISSSGHILLYQILSGSVSAEDRLFDAFVQIGSGAAIACYFIKKRKKIGAFDPIISKRLSLLSLVTSSLPVIFMGMLFHSNIIENLYNLTTVSCMWILGGFIFLSVQENKKGAELTQQTILKNSLIIGIFQIFALIPGVSRSGATIVGGLISGLSLRDSIQLSFFIAIPPLLGAGIYELSQLLLSHHSIQLNWAYLGVGAISAYISSSFFIERSIQFLTQAGLAPFGWYRIILGASALLYLFC